MEGFNERNSTNEKLSAISCQESICDVQFSFLQHQTGFDNIC